MGDAYLDVEVDGNTAFVQDHVRGLRVVFFFLRIFVLSSFLFLFF